jgi:hypothetical protein
MARFSTVTFCVLLVLACIAARAGADGSAKDRAKAVAAAREKGLDWLTKHQDPNGA